MRMRRHLGSSATARRISGRYVMHSTNAAVAYSMHAYYLSTVSPPHFYGAWLDHHWPAVWFVFWVWRTWAVGLVRVRSLILPDGLLVSRGYHDCPAWALLVTDNDQFGHQTKCLFSFLLSDSPDGRGLILLVCLPSHRSYV